MLGSSLVARPSHQRSPKPNPIWAGLGRLGCSAGLDARLILWLNIQPLAVLARGRPPANIVHPAGVPVAWPTPHGHRRVLQPVRSCSPGHGLVAAAISQQNAVFFVANVAIFIVKSCLLSCAMLCFSSPRISTADGSCIGLLIGTVLARGRMPTICEYLASVPGAWPTPHGHRRVLQPGRSRTPGATLWPHRITVHALHLRSC